MLAFHNTSSSSSSSSSPLQLPFPPKHTLRTPTTLSYSITSSSSSLKTNSNNNKNPLIQSLCKKNRLKQAIQLLSKEPNPTQHTYELLLRSCARKKSFSDALLVHRHLIDDGFDQDSFLAAKLINMYSELASIDIVRYVFDKIRQRTVFVWYAVLRAFAVAGHGEEAVSLCHRMIESGIAFDRFSYNYVLKACIVSGTLGMFRIGKEVHGHILRHGYETHVHVGTTLIDFYARFRELMYAKYVFNEMPEKNVVTWSAMIACLVKNGRPFEALELFWEMMVGVPNAVPNSVTMVSVLQACGDLSALEQGKLVHVYVLRRGLDTILPVVNSLMVMYTRCGSVEMGCRVFYQMDRRDVVSWNSMISSYGINGFGKEAVLVFQEMTESGVTPTAITFVSVLGACSHAGLVDEGKRLFDSMVIEHKIYPRAEHYACMVDLLGRAGRLDEAAKVVEEMRIEPGPTVWGSLLGACRIHCNVELAQRASRHLFELEPMNAGNYVLLADIYAEARMWEKVSRVKKLIEARGLRKVPGCSWIEVKRKIYSFLPADELNPHTEQLHALLVQLSLEMKEKGYIPDTKAVLYELDQVEKEQIILGHSEKLAVVFGLINSTSGETIRITKNLRLCEDCHFVTKFISEYTNREIFVRDVNRIHHFRNGICSCGDYW